MPGELDGSTGWLVAVGVVGAGEVGVGVGIDVPCTEVGEVPAIGLDFCNICCKPTQMLTSAVGKVGRCNSLTNANRAPVNASKI